MNHNGPEILQYPSRHLPPINLQVSGIWCHFWSQPVFRNLEQNRHQSGKSIEKFRQTFGAKFDTKIFCQTTVKFYNFSIHTWELGKWTPLASKSVRNNFEMRWSVSSPSFEYFLTIPYKLVSVFSLLYNFLNLKKNEDMYFRNLWGKNVKPFNK